MLADKFTIRDDFPPSSYDAWRAIVEADLKDASFEHKLVTHTYEGIDIQPLYTRQDQLHTPDADGVPGCPPFLRGATPLGSVITGWDLRQEHGHPDLETSNLAIRNDLQGGVTSLLLRLDRAARGGFDPDDQRAADWVGVDGISAYLTSDLATLLSGVDLHHVGVSLDAGAAFLPAAAMLAAFWRQQDVPADRVRGSFNADPLAVLRAKVICHSHRTVP